MFLEWWAQPNAIILQLVCMPQVRPKGIENVYCHSALVQKGTTSQMMFVFADGKLRGNVLQLLVGWSHALPLTRNSFEKNRSRIGYVLKASIFLSLDFSCLFPILRLPQVSKNMTIFEFASNLQSTGSNSVSWKRKKNKSWKNLEINALAKSSSPPFPLPQKENNNSMLILLLQKAVGPAGAEQRALLQKGRCAYCAWKAHLRDVQPTIGNVL